MKANKDNKYSYNKYVFLVLILFMVLVIMVAGCTYAVFTWTTTNPSRATGNLSSGKISCTFNEGSPISIKAAQPISDSVGKNLQSNSINGYTSGYFDSVISCTCSSSCTGSYEIYLKEIASSSSIDNKYIKVYLTDGSLNTESQLNPVTTFSNLITSKTDAKAKRLYIDSFSGDFSRKLRLRVWVADDYPVTNVTTNFNLGIYAKVYS